MPTHRGQKRTEISRPVRGRVVHAAHVELPVGMGDQVAKARSPRQPIGEGAFDDPRVGQTAECVAVCGTECLLPTPLMH